MLVLIKWEKQGDVNFEELKDKTKAITPVPGELVQ